MYQHMLRMYKYVLDTDQYILVCTCCVPVHTWMYSTEACLTGFRGVQRDANTRMPDVPSTHRFAVLWYIFKLVHTSTYVVHTRTYLVCTEYVQGHTKNDTVVLLCCSCTGYCTVSSTIFLLHWGRSPATPANHRRRVGRRHVRVAKEIMPDWNEVDEYVLVRH